MPSPRAFTLDADAVLERLGNHPEIFTAEAIDSIRAQIRGLDPLDALNLTIALAAEHNESGAYYLRKLVCPEEVRHALSMPLRRGRALLSTRRAKQ